MSLDSCRKIVETVKMEVMDTQRSGKTQGMNVFASKKQTQINHSKDWGPFLFVCADTTCGTPGCDHKVSKL